jgi:hypothetical protein
VPEEVVEELVAGVVEFVLVVVVEHQELQSH